MDADERAIYYYLKSRRPQCVSDRDIGRHAGGKRRFRYNPEWAKPVLLRMIERGILETDAEGYYRLKPMPQKETKANAGPRRTSPRSSKPAAKRSRTSLPSRMRTNTTLSFDPET